MERLVARRSSLVHESLRGRGFPRRGAPCERLISPTVATPSREHLRCARGLRRCAQGGVLYGAGVASRALVLCFALSSWACSQNPAGEGVRASVAPPPPTSAPASAVPDEPGIYYTFRPARDLSAMAADVCFVGPRPARLVPPTKDAAPLIRSAHDHAGAALELTEGAFALDTIASGDCIRYDVDLTGALDAESLRDGASLIGGDALLSPDWWLWAPEGEPAPPAFARFESQGGPHPAMPWPHEGRGLFDRRIPPTAFMWKAQGAFAQRSPRVLTVGDAKLDVTVLGAGFGEREPAITSWLIRSANAVAGLFGRFPLKRAQVLLVSDERRKESFGYALRGGGPSATLLLPPSPSDQALADDWTAVHELLHFSHPPMSTSEAWFFEGLATYLTALARARSAMTTKRYGWWELFDGFERGRKVGTGRTLRDECATMHQNRTYWRIYWSGASIFLQIDVALRKRGQTLERLIAELAASPRDESHKLTAEELMRELDKLCACDLPSKITARHLDDTAFPDPSALAQSLGVKLADDKSVIYDEQAPDAAIRRAIMGGD